MANFLTTQCANGQPSDTHVSEQLFGLCDDANQPNDPAYVSTDLAAQDTWIARVDNSPGYDVLFKAVDKCITVLKANGSLQKRCDGILFYQSTILFVELKERKDAGRQWANEGAEQVKQTIKDYTAAHGVVGKVLQAQVANRVQPNIQQAHTSVIKNFYQAMKIVLRVEGTIKL